MISKIWNYLTKKDRVTTQIENFDYLIKKQMEFERLKVENPEIETKAKSALLRSLEIPRVAGPVGKKKHLELRNIANDVSESIGRSSRYLDYDENAIYYGCHLEHYKWSWKLNKAVRL